MAVAPAAAAGPSAPVAGPSKTPAPAGPFYEVYRRTSLGVALMDSLDELIQNGDMPPALALKVLVQFDKANATTLVERVRSKWTARAGLQTYNLVEELIDAQVWTFILNDVTFMAEGSARVGPLAKCKIVACKDASAVDASASRRKKARTD